MFPDILKGLTFDWILHEEMRVEIVFVDAVREVRLTCCRGIRDLYHERL